MSKALPDEMYNDFYETYIKLVPDGAIADVLAKQLTDISTTLSDIPDSRSEYRYAEGKWSIKEVIGHITDTERVMSYRLLRIARGDTTPLPGFEQDLFIAGASFHSLTLQELTEDFVAVRRSTLSLLRTLSEEAWGRRGIASNSDISVKALSYIIAGHAIHHMNILQSRYLA